jgi:cellulose synthase operon protein C
MNSSVSQTFMGIVLATAISGQNAFAKPKRKAAAPAQSQSQKKKTIGELLKQADRGASLQQQAKQNIALPQTNLQLRERRRAEEIYLTNVKPPKSSAFFDDATDDQQKLEAITDKQMQELYKLTQRFRSSPQRGELWLRLASFMLKNLESSTLENKAPMRPPSPTIRQRKLEESLF